MTEIPNYFEGFSGENYPIGYAISSATFAELRAAGFHGGPDAEPLERKPGTAPAEELLVGGTQLIDPTAAETMLSESTYRVLRDDDDRIAAVWDEGRWFTPEESAAFTAALVAEMTGE